MLLLPMGLPLLIWCCLYGNSRSASCRLQHDTDEIEAVEAPHIVVTSVARMSNSDNSAVSAAWRRVAEKLVPLAAAATAAGEDSSATLSQAQCRALAQVADDMEEALLRCTGLPPSAFRHGVPRLVLQTVSSRAR
jgi:hypothetical protein